MTGAELAPWPVAGPLVMAALLLGLSKALPARLSDGLAVATALAACVLCAIMAWASAGGTLVYWFGDWHLIGNQVVGIAFVVDPAGAGFSALIGFLFAATMVFAWGFFPDAHAHFDVLMLVFMAGMIGFCLTGDLFDMFVWFELMSVAGFATTATMLRPSAIAGALNFTVVNTVGSYLFLAGIGLLYAGSGVLDLAMVARRVAADPGNPAMIGGFVMIAAALLIKTAQVPFQMWLGDAHAVAPSPVSVIFSGAMVGIGLFGLARLIWVVFGAAPLVLEGVQRLVLPIGLASALIGGILALGQRHIKRLLAFSTISHFGAMLVGLALLRADGTAGMLAYLIGHGLVKGALFMLAGFVLARCGGIDEVELRGAGRRYWPIGVVMAGGGLLLAGLPIGAMAEGHSLMEAAAEASGRDWVMPPILFSAALTGAAVLRVAGRVFVGWGGVPGEEKSEPSEHEAERERPLVLLAGPPVLLLVLGAIEWDRSGALARHAGAMLTGQAAGAGALHVGAGPWVAVAGAVALAAFDLSRRHLPAVLTRGMDALRKPPTRALGAMQSGLVTDYIAWLTVGLAALAVVFGLA